MNPAGTISFHLEFSFSNQVLANFTEVARVRRACFQKSDT